MPRRKPNSHFDIYIDPSCLDEFPEEEPQPTPRPPTKETSRRPPSAPTQTQVAPAHEPGSSTDNHRPDPDSSDSVQETTRLESGATAILPSIEFDEEPCPDADSGPRRSSSPSPSDSVAQMGDEHHDDLSEYGEDSVLHTESSHDRAYDDAGDSSSQPEVTDEDLFSQKGSVRSSLGSYDGGSESAKRADYAESAADTTRAESQYDTEEYISTIRGKSRPPFRTPSDLHSLQMASPAPSVYGAAGVGAPRSAKRAPFPTVSRLGSPSGSTNHSTRNRTPSRFQVKPEAPLVLLHATLLSPRWMWADVMNNLPSSQLSPEAKGLRDSWRMLQDRVGDTVCERGILLGHPQNDYEVLEERLLEALELPLRRRARILECGHYLGPANVTTPRDDEDSEDEDAEDRAPPTHWCNTCRHEIRYDALGSGKVFRVKVFASNGLMKAGAWAACWKEMERIDVELEPIVEPSVHEELVRLALVLDAQRKAEGLHPQGEASAVRPESRATQQSMGEDRRGRDDARTRDAYASASSPRAESHARPSPKHANASTPAPRSYQSASLPELIFRSVQVFLQDTKNIAILMLGAVALLLALRDAPQKPQFLNDIYNFGNIPEIQHVPAVEPHSAVVPDQEAPAQPTLSESVYNYATVLPSVAAQEEHFSEEAQSSESVAPVPKPSAASDALPNILPDDVADAISDAIPDSVAATTSETISGVPTPTMALPGTSAWPMVIVEPTSPATGTYEAFQAQVTETLTEKSVVRVVETVVETQTEFQTYRIKVTATATETETMVVMETRAPGYAQEVFDSSEEEADATVDAAEPTETLESAEPTESADQDEAEDDDDLEDDDDDDEEL